MTEQTPREERTEFLRGKGSATLRMQTENALSGSGVTAASLEGLRVNIEAFADLLRALNRPAECAAARDAVNAVEALAGRADYAKRNGDERSLTALADRMEDSAFLARRVERLLGVVAEM